MDGGQQVLPLDRSPFLLLSTRYSLFTLLGVHYPIQYYFSLPLPIPLLLPFVRLGWFVYEQPHPRNPSYSPQLVEDPQSVPRHDVWQVPVDCNKLLSKGSIVVLVNDEHDENNECNKYYIAIIIKPVGLD